jgi:hypothetical protein
MTSRNDAQLRSVAPHFLSGLTARKSGVDKLDVTTKHTATVVHILLHYNCFCRIRTCQGAESQY